MIRIFLCICLFCVWPLATCSAAGENVVCKKYDFRLPHSKAGRPECVGVQISKRRKPGGDHQLPHFEAIIDSAGYVLANKIMNRKKFAATDEFQDKLRIAYGNLEDLKTSRVLYSSAVVPSFFVIYNMHKGIVEEFSFDRLMRESMEDPMCIISVVSNGDGFAYVQSSKVEQESKCLKSLLEFYGGLDTKQLESMLLKKRM